MRSLPPRRVATLRFVVCIVGVLLCMIACGRSRLFSRSMSAAAAATLTAAKLGKPAIFPSPQKHTATLFFLHGLGDSADGGWSDVVPQFQARFPGLRIVLPNAPNAPVTLNGGMRMQSWHDIVSLNNIDKEEFKGLEESRRAVEEMLDAEVAAGTPSKRILLGGFSQGAAVSLYTGLQYPQTLGGILALSGYFPHNKPVELFTDRVAAANAATPVLMCHGEADIVVRFDIGKRSHDAILKLRKDNVTFKTYKNMGHHSSDAEMRDVSEWMAKVLA